MAFLVGWANEHGQLPSDVLAQYKENPRNFKLLMAWHIFTAQKQEQQREEAEQKAKGGGKGSKRTVLGGGRH